MENYTAENFEIVGQAMLKMAYNFWPIIVFVIVYALWEALWKPFERHARPKIKNANRDDGNTPYRSIASNRPRVNGRTVLPFERDASQQTGRRHL